MNSPINPHSHSPCISGSTTLGCKNVARETNSNPQRNTVNPDPWARLIGRANEEKILVNGKSVTALLDTGSQVTHISPNYHQAMGIPVNPIAQLVHIEGMGGYYRICGLLEAKLSFPMGPHAFKTEAHLLVLPTTNYQQRVPVTIGTSLTDIAVDSLSTLGQSKLSTSWKIMCCTTQCRRKVRAKQLQKSTIKTTKPITLPPFSTTVVKGHTKPKGHGMRCNLIAEPSEI